MIFPVFLLMLLFIVLLLRLNPISIGVVLWLSVLT